MSDLNGLGSIAEKILSIGSGFLGLVKELLDFAVTSFSSGDLIGILLCLIILKIVFMLKNGLT